MRLRCLEFSGAGLLGSILSSQIGMLVLELAMVSFLVIGSRSNQLAARVREESFRPIELARRVAQVLDEVTDVLILLIIIRLLVLLNHVAAIVQLSLLLSFSFFGKLGNEKAAQSATLFSC